MLLANTKDRGRIKPTKKVEAFCPSCGDHVHARMGQVRLNHWAHLPNSDCTYGRAMTAWHYRWIDRHYDKAGWEVEFIDENHRYDCFHPDKQVVLEIQRRAEYDYIMEKTQFVIDNGYKIKWIFHEEIFKPESFERTDTHYNALSYRRFTVLEILQYWADIPNVEFYIDTFAKGSEGRSSKGLVKLKPISSKRGSYGDFFRIRYTSVF
ncbi:MAG: hypothetical protein GYB18_08480 [Oceanospirillales bacterium]|nr:hypothetical protein [Oceanospirillales bacterium]